MVVYVLLIIFVGLTIYFALKMWESFDDDEKKSTFSQAVLIKKFTFSRPEDFREEPFLAGVKVFFTRMADQDQQEQVRSWVHDDVWDTGQELVKGKKVEKVLCADQALDPESWNVETRVLFTDRSTVWATFHRYPRKRDPNWTLVKIQ